MLARIHQFISTNHLALNGDRILLGVSGGIDSMVMAFMFLHLPFETGIVHCNFSLRGEEADLDEELVREFALKNDIPFRKIRFNTKQYASEKGISTQMAARDLRYEWFEKVRREDGYASIAIAHNLNDHAETMLINLVRGTGPAGLSGMKPKSGSVIRPLLCASREEIAGYASGHGIDFREDRTNAEVKYTRNRIRHLVMPVLADINPSVLNTLDDTASRFSEIQFIVDKHVEDIRSAAMTHDGEDHIYDLEKLRDIVANGTVLYGLFCKYGINNSQIDDLRNVLGGRSGSMIKTASNRIIRDRKKLIVTTSEQSAFTPVTIKTLLELLEMKLFQPELKTVDETFIVPEDRLVSCIDSDRLVFPLTIRKWEKGDFFFPLGMRGRKKLSDYFTDMKYSITEKEKKLVVVSESQIVCIPGDRIDDRYRITAETKSVLLLRKILP